MTLEMAATLLVAGIFALYVASLVLALGVAVLALWEVLRG